MIGDLLRRFEAVSGTGLFCKAALVYYALYPHEIEEKITRNGHIIQVQGTDKQFLRAAILTPKWGG